MNVMLFISLCTACLHRGRDANRERRSGGINEAGHNPNVPKVATEFVEFHQEIRRDHVHGAAPLLKKGR